MGVSLKQERMPNPVCGYSERGQFYIVIMSNNSRGAYIYAYIYMPIYAQLIFLILITCNGAKVVNGYFTMKKRRKKKKKVDFDFDSTMKHQPPPPSFGSYFMMMQMATFFLLPLVFYHYLFIIAS